MTITVVVCAYNEAVLLPGCLYSLLSQTRPPDEILVINNASTDATAAVARAVPHVRVVDEPTKGLVVARETGRRAAQSEVVAYIDADCRVPIFWMERVEAHFRRAPDTIGLTGPYRFYDWDWSGRTLIRLYDWVVAPPTHAILHHALGVAAILYGGNFAVRADALARIGGFDQTIDFHGGVKRPGQPSPAASAPASMWR
jgi:glycosyltransferase involved in cell wall biosynthesis